MNNKKLAFIVLSIVIVLLVYSPTPKHIIPEQYNPAQPIYIDQLQVPKNKLDNAIFVSTPADGAEDVEIDQSTGYIYSGLHDGSIIRVNPNGSSTQVIAKSQGPIFGIDLSHKRDKLVLADQVVGIRILDLKTKQFQDIVSQYNGNRFQSPNGVAFGANDQTLYFTVSSQHIKMQQFHEMLLYGQGSGRVFSYDLKTKQIQLLADKLHFANGLQYSEKDNCLYFIQTSRSRLNRMDLSPYKLGNVTVVLQNIMGYPDNVKLTESGDLWIALPALRDSFSNIIDHNSVIRKVLINLRVPIGMFLALANMKYSGGIKVNPKSGEIVQYFFGDSNNIHCVSGINEVNGKLVLSSLAQNKIAIVNLPQSEQQQIVYPVEQQVRNKSQTFKEVKDKVKSKVQNITQNIKQKVKQVIKQPTIKNKLQKVEQQANIQSILNKEQPVVENIKIVENKANQNQNSGIQITSDHGHTQIKQNVQNTNLPHQQAPAPKQQIKVQAQTKKPSHPGTKPTTKTTKTTTTGSTTSTSRNQNSGRTINNKNQGASGSQGKAGYNQNSRNQNQTYPRNQNSKGSQRNQGYQTRGPANQL